MARVTYREWAEWLGGASRSPFNSTRETRWWSILEIPVELCVAVSSSFSLRDGAAQPPYL